MSKCYLRPCDDDYDDGDDNDDDDDFNGESCLWFFYICKIALIHFFGDYD